MTGGLIPDVTFYLDIDPEIGLARIKRGERSIRKRTFIVSSTSPRELSLSLQNLSTQRIVVLDGSAHPDEVFNRN